ncbi:cystatin-C-like [Tachyglossus aculeatus]|uniref:cystatin-C-like n=1 Tax=Tachyglossus aculeatus TaxID=9261 RepID=UPI0018F78F3D|nr:cystatin-C-like [Tachyglossus aculeatus]
MGAVPLLTTFSLLLALPSTSWVQEVPATDPGTIRPNLLGGRRDLAVTDPEVQKLAHDVLTKYNQASDRLYYFRPVKVLKTQSPLVAGVKYYLTVELGHTSCLKNQVFENHMDLTTCPFALGSDQGNALQDPLTSRESRQRSQAAMWTIHRVRFSFGYRSQNKTLNWILDTVLKFLIFLQ